MTPQQKFAAARAMATERQPYLTSAILALVPIWLDNFHTLAVTKNMHVLIGRPAIERWEVKQIATGIVHEVWHILRDHHKRCELMAQSLHSTPEKIGGDWNTASDCEINDDLVAGGMQFPDGYGVLPEGIGMPNGKTAEEYFRHVQKTGQRPASGAPGSGESGEPPKGKPGKGSGKAQGKPAGEADAPGVGTGWCGSAGGRAVEGEPADGGEGEGDRPGRSQAEVKQIQRQVAEEIRKVAERGRGTVPEDMARWADQMIKPPKIPWQQKLARACRGAIATKAGAVDYRYTKPARRQGGMGYGVGRPVLPALRAPIPEVWFVVDTSGSMGMKELGRAASEADGVIRATGCNVTVMSNDAEIHATRKVNSVREAVELFRGGGGTDFRPPFTALRKAKVRPDVLVFATDGCGPAPIHPPIGTHVIWVLVGPYRQVPTAGDDDARIKWGEQIMVEEDDEKKRVSADEEDDS
jgi:predicted metal-dependent peptidase